MDLAAQYIKSAVKNVPSVFLMTDSQVAEEQFLVLINDLLASGEIPGLFTDDEVENIISSMRPQVKSMGVADTREACWKFFIEKVRKQLKVGPSSGRSPWLPVPSRVGPHSAELGRFLPRTREPVSHMQVTGWGWPKELQSGGSLPGGWRRHLKRGSVL